MHAPSRTSPARARRSVEKGIHLNREAEAELDELFKEIDTEVEARSARTRPPRPSAASG